jgi:hypothetical protein
MVTVGALTPSHRGRAGATDYRKATDNSGKRRSADRPGQQRFPSVRPGRPSTRIVSRTEEARPDPQRLQAFGLWDLALGRALSFGAAWFHGVRPPALHRQAR